MIAAKEEICSLSKENIELKTQIENLKSKEGEDMKVDNSEIEKSKVEIYLLKKELSQVRDEKEEVSRDQWANGIQEENRSLRYELGRMSHVLCVRNV